MKRSVMAPHDTIWHELPGRDGMLGKNSDPSHCALTRRQARAEPLVAGRPLRRVETAIDAVSWEAAELPLLDESMMVQLHRACGRLVVEHRGRHWVSLTPGLFSPVHHLAILTRDQATRPDWRCVAFRARLADGDAAAASATMPVHLMDRIDRYDLARLPTRRRQELKQGLRNLDVVALRTPDLLFDQGYRIVQEAHARNPGIPLPDGARFRRDVRAILEPPRGVVLAALRGGRLLGFAAGFAVEAAVYHQEVYVSDEGLPHHVSLCLFHALATLAARRGSIRELMHGMHIPSERGLCEFKRRIGLAVVHLPVRTWFAPGLGPLARWLRPEKYYRWTGSLPMDPQPASAT